MSEANLAGGIVTLVFGIALLVGAKPLSLMMHEYSRTRFGLAFSATAYRRIYTTVGSLFVAIAGLALTGVVAFRR
jgi:hypothetical protein